MAGLDHSAEDSHSGCGRWKNFQDRVYQTVLRRLSIHIQTGSWPLADQSRKIKKGTEDPSPFDVHIK